MNTDREIQANFLQWVKDRSSTPQTFIDDLAALLEVSRDSAYRRLRGETLLTFNEIRKISQHYRASLDTFFSLSPDSVLFQKRTINENYTYKDFLRSVLDSVNLINSDKGYKMTYVAKDIPPFHYFQFDGLSAFKSFFWLRTILKAPELQNQPYTPEALDPEIPKTCRTIWKSYQSIPSLEIWSDETINITLRQMEYYFDSGVMDVAQTIRLLEELQYMINHLRLQAELGMKLNIDHATATDGGKFELCYNEIEIGDNTVFFSMGKSCMVLKTFNMLNILTTTDVSFCSNIENYIGTILQKAVPISNAAEKERTRFFNQMDIKIEKLRQKVR